MISFTDSKKLRILSDDFYPLNYKILIDTDMTNDTFKGVTSILVAIKNKNSDFLYLNQKNLNIEEIYINREIVDFEYKKTFLIKIRLKEKHKRKKKFLLEILYHAEIGKNMRGYYKSNSKPPVYSTHFQTASARSAFPCFDQPDMKASFDIFLLAPENYTAISNNEVKKVFKVNENFNDFDLFEISDIKSIENKSRKNQKKNLININRNELFQNIMQSTKNKKLYIFQKTLPMSTYLVSWAIGEISYVEKITDYKPNIKIRVYTTKNDSKDGKYALDIACESIKYFQEYFNIKYPLIKLDMVEIPEFEAGAMENWGMITFKSSSLLYDIENSSFASKKSVAATVVHEIAHQWFGNLVTLKWWDDLWLNEGFATWAAVRCLSNISKDFVSWNAKTAFLANDINYGLKYDSLYSSNIVRLKVYDPENLDEISNGLSYSKGASILHMLEILIDEKSFQNGIQKYLKKFEYNNANSEDFWNVMTEVNKNFDINKIMANWIDKKGYPLITISDHKDILKIKQTRFLLCNINMNKKCNLIELNYEKFAGVWTLPLTFKIFNNDEKENTIKKFIFDKKNDFIDVDKQNFIFKNDGFGFYRLFYENREMLIKLIKNQNLTSENRYNIIDDIFQLHLALYLNINYLLEISYCYVFETNVDVLKTFIQNLFTLRTFTIKVKTVDGKIKKLIKYILKERLVIENINLYDGTSEQAEINILLLSAAISVNKTSKIIDYIKYFKKYIQNIKNIQPSYLESIFSSLIRYDEKNTLISYGISILMIKTKIKK
ncbi:hypothetical protein GVAV_000507 [Gurleya vavrai]